MTYTPKTVLKIAAVRHHEFGNISISGHVTYYICMPFVISILNFALIS